MATAVVDYLAAPVRDARGDRPTVVVPCIVPPLDSVPPRRDIDAARPLRLVSVGGLIERKDPLMAVDTVAELTRRGIPAGIRFVGAGPLRDAIEARAAELDVADAVELVGTLDRDGVLAELAGADLFLGPTLGDNFFVSCAEAVVAGRPVVVGSTGGQGEYLDPRVGVTVDTQTPQAYADAVEQVLSTSAGLSAEEIAATIGDRFSARSVAEGYDEAYRLAAQTHGGR